MENKVGLHDIEYYKSELERFKKLYFDLQMELDKIENLRKGWDYYSLKREKALEKLKLSDIPKEEVALEQTREMMEEWEKRKLMWGQREFYRAPECLSDMEEGLDEVD